MISYQRKFGKLYFKASNTHGAEVHRSMANRLVTEAPLTRDLSVADLHGFLIKPLRTDFLCHAQPCERGVKLTSDSCASKAGYTKQLGLALLADKGRKQDTQIRALQLWNLYTLPDTVIAAAQSI